MSNAPILGAGAAFLVVITLSLIRLGWGAGGWHWAAAWCCLWASGAINSVSAENPALAPLYPILGTCFAALLFSGACVFAGRDVPRWLAPTAAAVAIVRAGVVPYVGEPTIQITGSLGITLGAMGGIWQILRPAEMGRRNWQIVLASSLAVVVATSWVFAYVKVAGLDEQLALFLWLVTGSVVGGVQVVSLLGRVAQDAEQQRADLAAVLDAVPVGLVLVQPDGRLRATNQAFEKLLPLEAATGPVRLAGVLESLRGQLEDPTPLDEPFRYASPESRELRFRDGKRVLSSLRPVFEPGTGRPLGQLWQLIDVTEERRLQEGLERARRLDTLGGFAGGVAHDFNNQLTSVLGNTALLRDAVAGNPSATEILDDLEGSADYCATLTKDVLDFARRNPPRPEPLDVASLLPRMVRRDAHAEAPARTVVAPELPPILADPISLERVVFNLVDNARAAAGPAGSVEVRAHRSAPDRVSIEVLDDGPGIDEAVRGRIFDPFFTTKPVGQGTGLGLAIVYGIVSMLGGEVRAENRPNGGTHMITTWPVASPNPGTGARTERSEPR